MLIDHKLSNLSKIVNCDLIGNDAFFEKVSTDTRSMAEGDIFLALKGPNHNGHDFINKALDKGASCLITEKEIPGETYIKTENTFLLLEELAKFQRLNFKQDVIAITGSNGKTSTKEILYQLTKNFLKTRRFLNLPEIGIINSVYIYLFLS